jgi:hypothetical protein
MSERVPSAVGQQEQDQPQDLGDGRSASVVDKQVRKEQAVTTATEVTVGDIVVGRFSCTGRAHKERARVTSLYEEKGVPAFLGEWIDERGNVIRDDPERGWGVWGYYSEIERVEPA